MSRTESNSKSGGVGVAGLLGVAFIVLKLTHVIAWSWWWVLAPFWIPAVLVIVVLAVVAVVAVAKR
jgi:fatty acid desaturase